MHTVMLPEFHPKKYDSLRLAWGLVSTRVAVMLLAGISKKAPNQRDSGLFGERV